MVRDTPARCRKQGSPDSDSWLGCKPSALRHTETCLGNMSSQAGKKRIGINQNFERKIAAHKINLGHKAFSKFRVKILSLSERFLKLCSASSNIHIQNASLFLSAFFGGKQYGMKCRLSTPIAGGLHYCFVLALLMILLFRVNDYC